MLVLDFNCTTGIPVVAVAFLVENPVWWTKSRGIRGCVGGPCRRLLIITSPALERRAQVRVGAGSGESKVASGSRVDLGNSKGFSRVMTRPADGVKGVSKPRGSGRVGSLRFKISRVGRVGSGWVKRFSKSRGSGRVKRLRNLAGRVGSGQEVIKSRGSGRVGSRGFQNLAGRVRSGQDVFKISRVGSYRVKTSR